MPSILGEKREGSISITRSNGRNTVRAPFHYTVVADTVDQDRLTIAYSTAGLPPPGAIDLSYGVCVGSTGTRSTTNPLYWDWVCEFSTEAEEGQDPQTPQGQNSDPTAWIPIAELQYETITEVLRKDINGKLWQNSAKSAFETGLVRQRRLVRRDFFQFEPDSTTIEEIEERHNTVNDDVYLTRAAKTLRLDVRSAKIGYYYGRRCWLIDYSMTYKPDTWTVKMLNVGYSYLDPATTPPKRKDYIVDKSVGIILGALKSDGDKVADQDDDPSEESFEIYEQADFSTFLRFPNP